LETSKRAQILCHEKKLPEFGRFHLFYCMFTAGHLFLPGCKVYIVRTASTHTIVWMQGRVVLLLGHTQRRGGT